MYELSLVEREAEQIQKIADQIRSLAGDEFDQVILTILDFLIPDATSQEGMIPMDKAMDYSEQLEAIKAGIDERLEKREWWW